MRSPHDEDPSPRRMSRRGLCRPPTGVCRPPGTPWTSRNTSRRRYLRDGRARRYSPRRAIPQARCGSSLLPNTADGSDAGCPSALVLPALCSARISVSSSLLAATMNQKSSLRKVPQFASRVLMRFLDQLYHLNLLAYRAPPHYLSSSPFNLFFFMRFSM